MLDVTSESLSASSGSFVAGASGSLIPLNTVRNGLNVEVDAGGTGTVYFLLGAGTASATNWHISLAPGGSWDGHISGALWRGAVQFFSAGTPRVAVVEF